VNLNGHEQEYDRYVIIFHVFHADQGNNFEEDILSAWMPGNSFSKPSRITDPSLPWHGRETPVSMFRFIEACKLLNILIFKIRFPPPHTPKSPKGDHAQTSLHRNFQTF